MPKTIIRMGKQEYISVYATKRRIVTLFQRLFIFILIIGKTNTSRTTPLKVCASARRSEILDLKQLQAKWLLKNLLQDSIIFYSVIAS